jgi:prephenate dehydratase
MSHHANTGFSESFKVTIQGSYGAFHEIAARHYCVYPRIEIVPAETFLDVLNDVNNGIVHQGLMAIENSIAGSLFENYKLLLKYPDLRITGEIFLRIRQNLIAFPNSSIRDLTEVHSHPVALKQCEAFFAQYPHIKLVEATDTALVAKQIRENQYTSIGAIGSSLAAEMYQLDILAANIESVQTNYTRFLVLNLEKDRNFLSIRTFNKVSICFSAAHEIGTLGKICGVLTRHHANITTLQSLPIMTKTWEYFFCMDFVFDAQKVDYQMIINELYLHTTTIRILGVYQQGTYFGND